MDSKTIHSALISVYHKDGLDTIIRQLHAAGVNIISTGGTHQFIESLGVPCTEVEQITGVPAMLDGRVKTLHPKVFGGILARRSDASHQAQMQTYDLPEIDLVIVDLYPFEATVASGASEADIIEKIDIGGISLIRAAAKNYHDVVIVPSKAEYAYLEQCLLTQGATTTLAQRATLACKAFGVSSHYDTAIHRWLCQKDAAAE